MDIKNKPNQKKANQEKANQPKSENENQEKLSQDDQKPSKQNKNNQNHKTEQLWKEGIINSSEKTPEIKGRYRISLRIYMAIVSIVTLCFSCCFAFFLVYMGTRLFYKGPYTSTTTTFFILLVCILTMIIGAFFMFQGSYHLTKPLAILTNAAQKIAKGDFTIRIQRRTEMRKEYLYTNEIDELSENFNQMADQLSRTQLMRKDFVSNVSHELKTPIFAIAGISELLLEDKLDETEKKEYLHLLHEESERMSRLCDHMLQLSRLDHSSDDIKEEQIRVDEQIRHAVILLSERWQEKEAEFKLDLEEITITANQDLFMQVWINLIDNAMKYSNEKPYIQVKACLKENKLVVEIKDKGIGISTDKQDKIFDQFYQCDESHKKNGNGLGLSIVKKIIEIYNGTISCISEVNKGTNMRILIPLTGTERE